MAGWDVGQVLSGRYRLDQRLSAGGMGRVWRAFDLQLHRAVAVKELMPPEGADMTDMTLHQELVQRIRREARAAANVRHPSLVAVHDITADPTGVPAVVMELVDGEPLDTLVRREGRLTVAAATEVARQVLDALATAHGAGVVHRDVKPANILWDGRRAVVVDFGIATLLDTRVTALTRSGMLVGTQPYLAPEQFRGEPVTAAVDLWGLGVTLFELVEGRRPFRADSPEALMRAILDAPAPAPEHAGALAPLIAALLSKDPAARPDPADAARLLPPPVASPGPHALSPATVRLRAGSPRASGGRRPRRGLLLAGAAVALAAVAGVTTVLLTSGSGGSNQLVLALTSSTTSQSQAAMLQSLLKQDGVSSASSFPPGGGPFVLACVRPDKADQVAAELRRLGASEARVLTDPQQVPSALPPAVLTALRVRIRACAEGGTGAGAGASAPS